MGCLVVAGVVACGAAGGGASASWVLGPVVVAAVCVAVPEVKRLGRVDWLSASPAGDGFARVEPVLPVGSELDVGGAVAACGGAASCSVACASVLVAPAVACAGWDEFGAVGFGADSERHGRPSMAAWITSAWTRSLPCSVDPWRSTRGPQKHPGDSAWWMRSSVGKTWTSLDSHCTRHSFPEAHDSQVGESVPSVLR